MRQSIRMSKRFGKAAAAIASAVVIIHAPAAAQSIPSETWMGIYLGSAKIGYTKFSIDNASFRSTPGYRLDNTSVINVLVLGHEVRQSFDTSVYLNKEFEPIHEVFKMSSAGNTTTVTARFYAEEIVARVETERSSSTTRIPIPSGSKITIEDNAFLPPGVKLEVGDTLDFKCFDPLDVSLDDVHTEVLREEEIELGGEKHKTFVIRSETSRGETVCWQDEKGNLLKMTTIMGTTMIREPKETAKSFPTDAGVHTPPDLAVMTSARTTTKIPNPREVKYMKVRLSGLVGEPLLINDRRQKVTFSNGDDANAEYEIKASEFDPAKAVSLPVKELQEFLADSPYVQPTNPEILAAAKEIVGDEKNAYKAVSRLRAWVGRNIESKGDIGILRSSVDLLHAKTGVCRDCALLYTALARAAGIPTKFVAGLMYWKDGFYYHAWAESFVGEWIPVDATLPTDFVDATHIKLAEGDTTALFDAAKTVGSLKAEILEFK